MQKPPSIVRRGNHFLYLESSGWVLIDGPWFERLSLHKNEWRVRVLSTEPTPCCSLARPPLTWTPVSELVWEKVRWHPGLLLRFTEVIWSNYLKYQKMRDWELKRHRYGWRTLPDGRLPAYFNGVDRIDGGWWDLELYRRGY